MPITRLIGMTQRKFDFIRLQGDKGDQMRRPGDAYIYFVDEVTGGGRDS